MRKLLNQSSIFFHSADLRSAGVQAIIVEKKSPLADEYNTDTRVITWGDCKIICKEKEMTLSVGKSSILLTNSGIVITAPSVNFKKG